MRRAKWALAEGRRIMNRMKHIPAFYHAEDVGQLYVPRTEEAVNAGLASDLLSAEDDEQRTLLLLIDAQVDFVHTDGALSVPGAVDDTRRTIEWIFRHAERITAIAASLDSHIPTQIFYPTWWVDEQGNHPTPYTVITCDEVDRGVWRPVYEPQWSLRYVHELETDARKQLMIWPYHTMIGTPGHAITPALYEAIAFHAAARGSEPLFLHKGMIAKTEFYSMLEPEVKVVNEPQGELNVEFLKKLMRYDRIYVAGQAKSHCVLETITSVMRHYHGKPEALSKWYVLTDCMSSVAHPQIDFDAMANRYFEHFAETGLNLVQSTDPLP